MLKARLRAEKENEQHITMEEPERTIKEAKTNMGRQPAREDEIPYEMLKSKRSATPPI